MMGRGSNNVSDHDLLVELKTLMEVVRKGQENHLAHHNKRDLMMLAVTLGALFTALVSIGCSILAYIK